MGLRTPLYDTHAALGATFVPFAGYDMPVNYGSIKDEHRAVRERVGLFDVSHMSNLWVTGKDAAATIGRVCPFDPASLAVGRAKYSVILHPDGTILDDTIVFRLGDERFLVVPNAGMNEAVAAHLRMHADSAGLAPILDDATARTAILALQGPLAATVAEAAGLATPKPFTVEEVDFVDATCVVSGTGYTGEKGLEICVPADRAAAAWDALMAAGEAHGIAAIGLGARDTLRLEKAFCLAGHEFEGGRTPLEAGLNWLIDWDHDFLGKEVLLGMKERGGFERLRGFTMERGVPRQGMRILKDGNDIGVITSGTQSPNLGIGIALGYARGVKPGDEVELDVRGKPRPARVVKTPFV